MKNSILFHIYALFNNKKNQEIIFKNQKNSKIGTDSNELVLKSAMFKNFSSIFFWKVELKLNLNYSSSSGMSSIILKVNQLPTGGICYFHSLNGTSLETDFFIKCIYWSDPDGTIEKYEFYGNF